MKIDAVIMAKSNMFGKFCVAGIDLYSGRWVRFVSFEDGQPLSDFQLIFINSPGTCKILDTAKISIARKIGHSRQNHSEDFMIKYDAWLKLGEMDLSEIIKIHPPEFHDYIFGNLREYLTLEEIHEYKLNYSLIFIEVENLRIYHERKFYNEIKPRASFDYNGDYYTQIRITDPDYDNNNYNDAKNLIIPHAYLVMSMPAKPLKANGRFYKLIAKIFVS